MLRWITYGLSGGLSKALTGMLLLLATGATAERVHILALGDSLTQGYGLIEQEGFVPQLRDWLAARGHDVRIVNAGVSGDTTAGGLARVDWSLTPEIQAMIVALGGNDLLRGIDPAVSRANIEGILKVAEARELEVLLIGMQAPGNYGPDYKAAFDALYPDLAQSYDALYLESFFAGLMQDGEAPADLRAFMQPDGIHPNATGVVRIVDAVGPMVESLIERVGN
ncbi:arylesterase [Antarctobacter heliothermus]|uniref:Acyl-CoA thioesterase-1 n=1 Tax=Antarctobacter heliothermus TaxID=74033 RepID=A0A239IGR6_9RHOB|nr:arylesterase [Antarctobacter heliothermus]SNS92719.1 acyl-CoA thioesterase-1 [Antarctobacter heliothermus]